MVELRHRLSHSFETIRAIYGIFRCNRQQFCTPSPGYNKLSHLTVFPCKSTLLIGRKALKKNNNFFYSVKYIFVKKVEKRFAERDIRMWVFCAFSNVGLIIYTVVPKLFHLNLFCQFCRTHSYIELE